MSLNNKMESAFKLIWNGENNFPSQVKIARHENSGMACSVKIIPSSKMEGEIVLRQPPVTIKEYIPVKDAYVNEGVPKLNYGKSNILKIGIDENGKRNRAFMDFNISDLPRNMYIAEATLEIISYDSCDFEYLEISSATKEYEEYGLTWDNQVTRDKVISIEVLDKNTKKYVFNVTEVVSNDWYGKDFNNHGFILKGYDETKKQMKEFSSRESYNPPKLIIKYMDLATSEFGGSKLTGNVQIRTKWNNGIAGNVTVHRYDSFHLLPSKVHILNREMCECQVFIIKRSVKGKVIVRQKNNLFGNVQIRMEGVPIHLNGNVIINQNHILCNALVKQIFEFPSKVHVSNRIFKGIISNIVINGITKGNVQVKVPQGLACQVQVKYGAKSELVSSVLISSNVLKGTVQIKSKSLNSIAGHLIVKYKNDFIGHVTISREYIVGKVEVINHSTLASSLNIKGLSKITGDVKVKLTRYKSVVSSVIPKAQITINASVQVNSQFMRSSVNVKTHKAILGRAILKTYDSINSSVEVINYKNIKSIVSIRNSGFYDIVCSIQIKSKGGKKSYAFIM
ncbi:DNRLRE domain-containing protein [Clostridium tagluense]|uniref:Carbohydrate-binding module family 96 domain-containing protein n=1 Tax=Clostridium tagluense TaxID=360422 RepID=A0A401UQI3_9CLOT|nr:DNRLRE domain-containing protein [Clostridium tagluense]GCD11780.1 hypothetical protein Ctaglu_34030 [Clostridium tagluense]